MNKALLVLLALCFACQPATEEAAPDFVVDGVGVYVESQRPWMTAADAPARVAAWMQVGAEFWGSDLGALGARGLQVTVTDDYCFDPGIGGMYWRDRDTGEPRICVATRPALGECVEALPLPHELGHAVLDELNHADPRFSDGTLPLPGCR